MTQPHRSLISATALLTLCLSPPAAAQDSREAEIAAKQAEKAKGLKVYVPSTAERIITNFEREAIERPSGPFPFLDSPYRGGGFTFGAGYRQFFGDASSWDIKGAYSIKAYKLIETGVYTPVGTHGRTGLRVGWIDATQVAFYGLGINTLPEARANFRLKETYAEGILAFRPKRWIVLDGAVAYEDYTTEEGLGSAPSIETVYTPITAPGLGASPAYLHAQATAGIDWRQASPAYARSGGFYGVTLHDYADQDDVFSFRRLDADVVQHVPILRDTWVLSFHARMETTLDDDDVVPYFLLPSLGSGKSLRAYSSWRFRDRHSLLGQAEFRWIPNRLGMDMALFYDAGKVASRREDLDFDNIQKDWGLGVRFHLPAYTFLRLEAARGAEGWHFVFSSSAAF
jgi:Omp85 superfamily domain